MPVDTAEVVFFLALALIFYAYVGYWLLLRLTAGRKPVVVSELTPLPTVSIVIAARNEGRNLPRKLENIHALDYPQDLLQIIVVSDGSTDNTAEELARHPEVHAILLPQSGGKALALNEAVRHATGDLLFFMDARQMMDSDALRRLVAPFSDATVGAVSGELLLESDGGDALGLYWKIEKSVRRLESESGSVVGVTGAIYMLRRSLAQPLPAGLILDDVLVPMQAVRQGKRVLFQPAAVARDRVFTEPGKEFQRKVRTLTGNLQLVQLAPWLLSPANPILFRFISHKLLRLAVPFLLILMLVASGISNGPLMRLLFWVQLLFFGLALIGTVAPSSRRWRPVAIPATFVMLNAAAAVAFYKFFARKSVWN
jgi:cellulose synthase/poly-beta-1,6-N-acetylglucosamine synthase-like glycosyltransferase